MLSFKKGINDKFIPKVKTFFVKLQIECNKRINLIKKKLTLHKINGNIYICFIGGGIN